MTICISIPTFILLLGGIIRTISRGFSLNFALSVSWRNISREDITQIAEFSLIYKIIYDKKKKWFLNFFFRVQYSIISKYIYKKY